MAITRAAGHPRAPGRACAHSARRTEQRLVDLRRVDALLRLDAAVAVQQEVRAGHLGAIEGACGARAAGRVADGLASGRDGRRERAAGGSGSLAQLQAIGA